MQTKPKNDKTQATQAEKVEQASKQAPAPAYDMAQAKNDLRIASANLNDESGKTTGAHASKVNVTFYLDKVTSKIAEEHGEKHAFDIVQGVTLFLKHELRLAFKKKEKDGAMGSVSLDNKGMLSSVESPKRAAYDAFIAYQTAIIASEKAYKAGLLYVRPAPASK